MLSLGLIGFPLGHSLSPRLHAAALAAMGLDGEYRLYPLPPGPEFAAALQPLLEKMRLGEVGGLNVTIPHKQAVQPFLDAVAPSAQAIGAVNTIVAEAGRLTGENTDAPGFLADLLRAFPGLEPGGAALVLGAGGAARAAAYALADSGWQVMVAARRLEQAESLRAALQAAPRSGPQLALRAVRLHPHDLAALPHAPALLVNASAAGMSPNIAENPWPEGLPLPPAAVYDLVYNPAETGLLRQAAAAGLPVCGGIGMLIEQAALALERWTGLPVPRSAMWSAVANQTDSTQRHGAHRDEA